MSNWWSACSSILFIIWIKIVYFSKRLRKDFQISTEALNIRYCILYCEVKRIDSYSELELKPISC